MRDVMVAKAIRLVGHIKKLLVYHPHPCGFFHPFSQFFILYAHANAWSKGSHEAHHEF